MGVALKAMDECFASGELIETGTQLGSHRAGLGSTGRRELEESVGPGEEAVDIHKAGFGTHRGRGQTGQEGVLEVSRDPPASAQEGLEGGVILIETLEHRGNGVGEVIEAGAGQSMVCEVVNCLS